LLSLCLVLAPFLASQAQAADDETTGDLRCLVTSLSLTTSDDQTAKTAGLLASLYYFGRLDGRAPNLDLENRMVGEIEKMTPDEVRSEAARCGSIMRERGQTLTAIGNHLVERGQRMLRQGEPPVTP
jgi:hypothetical protein